MSTTYVLYHHHCDDGFGAAYAAWKKLGERAAYLPVVHGEPPPEIPDGARVVIADFAYPRSVLLEMSKRMENIQVLDHHKTAREDLEGLPFALLDMNKSGAMLSWEYWHPGVPPPALLQYIEDRDLWRFALPESHEVAAALESFPRDFQVWEKLDVATLRQEGKPILRAVRQQVAKLADRATFQDVAGYSVPVVNATAYISDVLHELARRYPNAPFTACYFELGDGKKRWGLASIGDFDVSKVAKTFGGGGHKNRSGFTAQR